MNYHRIYKNDFVNGEGVRTTLFVSGCDHACKGCYNKSTWNPNSGEPFTYQQVKEILESIESDHVSGLSITGGDPLHENNMQPIMSLIVQFREKFGNTKNIWLWTGYTFKEIKHGAAYGNADMIMRLNIIEQIDVLIDGKFEQDKFEHGLPFRGSTNQIIHRFKL
ncbi:MAG: anaerobic ribonucleoside-triphosphate reductase activating protein [Bacteroidales bacterium]